MSKEVKVKLNGKEITLEQLEEKKKEYANLKDMKLIEITPNVYQTRINS